MAKLFISHSSKDKAEAVALMHWLEDQGFDYLFLDSDISHGIKIGEDWEKALYREINQSHGFICLLSENWLSSQWCGFEFLQARALGKAIFPIRIQAGLKTQVANTLQHLDLTQDRNVALEHLQGSLADLMLSVQRGFEWNPMRSPYPGMISFEEEDAAVFFGRDDEINRLRERLESHRTQGSANLLAILAASGAGKSSLLKAGLLPRMKRDTKHWIVLDALRPETEPLKRLAQILSQAMGDELGWKPLYKAFQEENAIEQLAEFIDELRVRHKQLDAYVLLSIDQAEELFSTADTQEVTQLLQLLTLAQAQQLPLLTVMAIRSDYLEALQKHPVLKAENNSPLSIDLYSLEGLPSHQIGRLIRGPASVAGITVEDDLIIAATKDAATKDTLPLLAFALRELFDRFGTNGHLTLDSYTRLGSDSLSPLENAVQQKAEQAIHPAVLSDTDLQALRDAFIPHMVRVSETGDYVRQPARWSELPAAALPLIDKLTNARLLVQRQLIDSVGGRRKEKYVEVAHEALLRHWQLLNIWLNEEHDFLVGKQRLEHSLRDWEQVSDEQKDTALLKGIALERAREWLFTNRAGLSTEEKSYIFRSHQAEEKQRKRQRNFVIGFIVGLSAVAAIAIWQAYSARVAEQFAQQQQNRAEASLSEANKVISYINFDLRDDLEPIVPLPIVDEMRKRVTQYYQNLDGLVENQNFLQQSAINASNRADAFVAQGKLDKAEQFYHEANQFMQYRAKSDPSNTAWQRDYSVSLNSLGDILQEQGKLEPARKVFEDVLSMTEKLVNIDPTNMTWQHDLASGYGRLGDVAFHQGKLDEAMTFRNKAQALLRVLSSKKADSTILKRDLAVSLESLGDTLTVEGKFETAREKYMESLSITEQLLATDASNTRWLRDLSVGSERMGNVLKAQGLTEEAMVYFEKSLSIAEELVAKDTSNAIWKRDLASSYSQVGNFVFDQEKYDEAYTFYKKAKEILQRLVDSDASNIGWRQDLAVSLNHIGNTLLNQNKIEAAQIIFEEDLSIAKELVEIDQTNKSWLRDLSVSFNTVGDILLQQGKLDEAELRYNESYAIRKKLVSIEPGNAEWKVDLGASNVKFMRLAIEYGDIQGIREYGGKALALFKPLSEKGALHSEYEQWIETIEGVLDGLTADKLD